MRRRGKSKRSLEMEQARSEVREILWMWSVVEHAYGQFSEDERNRIELEADGFGSDVRFLGFSGNEETAHLSAARDLVYGDFHMFRGRDLNSHLPYLGWYRQMLRIFKGRLNTRPAEDLSVSDIIALMKARRPPDD